MTTALLQLGLITVLLVGGVGLLVLLVRWFTGSWRTPIRSRRPPEPRNRPVEAVAADLHRLGRQLSLVPAGTPRARRVGLQAAYDDVLLEAARLLEVANTLSAQPPGRARDAERSRLQTALEDAGLVVRG